MSKSPHNSISLSGHVLCNNRFHRNRSFRTAVIQTTIIALALFVFNVPGAPILTLIVLFFAIAQIPIALIVIPIIIYMFSATSGTNAVIFAVWGIVGALSDNFIKPMLPGRGMKIPMLII